MAKIAEVQEVSLGLLRPYEKNAKIHGDYQIKKLMESLEEFGPVNPCLIDRDYNLIAGHGRVMAAERLGWETFPCVFVEGLTDAQRRAYILADNRLSELGEWDMETVDAELRDLTGMNFDIDVTGFELTADWFEGRERWTQGKQEGNDEYNEFVEKFEVKRTTDDCYTPDNVYDAVADWVANEYGIDRSAFVRPFYPGGDYENEEYPDGCVVVDNPPFSILAQICRFYIGRGIPFFLFAPTLTLFSADCEEICHVATNADITYENGARVNTGFKTNLEKGLAVRTAPALTAAIKIADRENTKSDTNLMKYAYPANVVTAAKVSGWSEYGVDFRLPRDEVRKISALDAQKEKNLGIYGSGFLISSAQAAQAAQAAGIDVSDINENGEVVWRLSDREKEIIAELDRRGSKNA